MSRYLVQSILSGVDYIKFAFVSRKDMGKNNDHVVCATHTVKTLAWAKQSNMSMDRMWCIIKRVVEEVEEVDPDTWGTSEWKAFLREHDVKTVPFLTHAKFIAKDTGIPHVGTLKAIAGSGLARELSEWVENGGGK